MKGQCQKLEEKNRLNKEQAEQWKTMYEDLKREMKESDIGNQNLGIQQSQAYENTIDELESKLAEQGKRIQEFNIHTELLSTNLQTEQETSNNLLISLDNCQSKIE